MNESVWTVVFRGEGSSALRTSKQVRNELGQVERQSHRTGTSFRGAERDLGRLSRGAIAGSGLFRGFGRSIAFASGTFLGGVGFIAAVRGAIGAAGDLNTQQARSITVFRGSGKEIQDWSRTTYRSLGLSRVTALETANAFGTLFASAHIAPADSARFSRDMARVAAAISLARGEADPSSARQALAVGLAGRGRALRLYGIQLDQVSIKEEAARLGLARASVDSTKLTLARDQLAIATAKAAEAHRKYGANTTQAHAADDAVIRAQENLRKVEAGTAGAIGKQATALAAHSLIMRQAQRYLDRYGASMNTSAGRQRRFHEGTKELREELGTALLPTFNRVLDRINRYMETLAEGGSRHAAFIRTLREIGRALHTTWDVAMLLGRGLRTVANVMGGWQNAFKLVLGLVLLNKFLKLQAAIRDSRLALLLLGAQAPRTAAAVEGAEAGMAAGMNAPLTKTARLRSLLLGLGRLGLITVGIEVLIHYKTIGKFLGIGQGPATIPTAGDSSAVQWARYYQQQGLSRAQARQRMRRSGLWYGNEREIDVALDRVYGRAGSVFGGGGSGGGHGTRGGGTRTGGRNVSYGGGGYGAPTQGLSQGRVDMGVDYSGSGYITAIADGVVTFLGMARGSSHGGNGPFLIYRIAGPRYVYVAEQWRPLVRVGERIKKGQRIGVVTGGHIEIGWAAGPTGVWNTAAAGHYHEGDVTAEGTSFLSAVGGGGARGRGGTVGGGGLYVGHTPPKPPKPPKPHYVSEATRLAEALRIRSYERRVHQAERQDYITPQQERRDIARLERLRKLLASGHLTPTQMARIRAQVADLWRQINKQIDAGVTAARKKAERLAAAHRAAIEKAERIVQVKRDAFEKAWGRMADKALEAFDRITSAGEDAISKKYDAPTPAEAALNAIQQMQSQEDLAAGVTGAQSKLALARRLGDPQMIAEAEKELRDAQLAVQQDSLEKQAAIERDAAEKRKAKELKEYDDARQIQRQKLEDMLNDLQKKLDEGNISWFNAQKQLQKILGDNLGPIGQLGALIGDTFTQALLDSVTGVGGAADALAKALQEVEKLGYRWNPETGEWEKISYTAKQKKKPGPPPGPPIITGHHPPGEATAGLAGGGIARRPVLRWIGERYREEAVIPLHDQRARQMLRSAFGAGGGDVHYHHYEISVPNYLGREQDVARSIRTELLKLQRAGMSLGFQTRRRSLSSTTPFADRGLR